MKIIIILLAIYGFLEGTSYGIYEYQTNKNKPGGVCIIILAIFRTCSPYLRSININNNHLDLLYLVVIYINT